MSMSSVAMCLVIFLSLVEIFECRGVDNLGLEDFGPAGMKAKRRIFDTSCKGFYDRGLFAQLDRVCEDCYNLYRKPHVAAECSNLTPLVIMKLRFLSFLYPVKRTLSHSRLTGTSVKSYLGEKNHGHYTSCLHLGLIQDMPEQLIRFTCLLLLLKDMLLQLIHNPDLF
ncbi:hypothetical protein Avbf_15101 [Armadillidium vulgare]|nr:hypothetical protein Avbf_15101 [Armadillidium vulgare]